MYQSTTSTCNIGIVTDSERKKKYPQREWISTKLIYLSLLQLPSSSVKLNSINTIHGNVALIFFFKIIK